ncbi:MAG: BtrH N-terminal domain-containing protein [Candidatus Promineifilaceae bacterium]|jgi:hypothetical protein
MVQPEEAIKELAPYPKLPALAGYYCWSSSLAKIYHHYSLPLAEEMFFGLGEEIDFLYWEQKGASPIIGRRGNINAFAQDIGRRTGIVFSEQSTSSTRKAQKALLQEEPQLTTNPVPTPLSCLVANHSFFATIRKERQNS